MTDLNSALLDARATSVRDEYATRVKAIFARYLDDMEAEASVEDTHYFNHSAIPDFVLTWPTGRRRDVYLRASYASIVAADEPTRIRTGDPIFMALDDRQHVEERGFEMSPDSLAHLSSNSTHSLLTDVAALDEIRESSEGDSPLSSVVRSNFLRGARGLIDEPVAEQLVEGRPQPDGAGVSELIKEKFFEDAVFRMERTAALVQWALAGDSEQMESDLAVLEGRMSTDELTNVLPWILRQDGLTRDPAFWSRLGGLVDFDQLEQIGAAIEGLDVSHLISANATRWGARRGYLGLNISENADEDARPAWRFIGGVLSLSFGSRMVKLSHSGHKLRGRPDNSVPRWSMVRDRLGGYPLRAVSLSGIERAVSVEARQGNNVLEDVDAVTSSVSDDYFVSTATLSLPVPGDGEVEPADVDVDFAAALAVSKSSVELAALTRATLNLIDYATDTDEEKLRLALGE